MRNFPAQYTLNDEDVLYFSHIPKTAGMTFRTIVEDQFDDREICPATLNAQVAKIPKDQLKDYRLFRGHLGFINIPELLPGKEVVNVTILREPIARVISHYEYIRRMPGDPHYRAVKDMTLAEFAQKLTAGKVGKNIQTYHVAKAMRFKLDDLTPEETLALAKESLDNFAFVGLVERFQDSLFLLSYILGWKPILNSRKENAAKKKKSFDEIPAETLEIIRENSLLDLELYHYAQEIFETRFNEMVQQLISQFGTAADQAETISSDRLKELLELHYEQRYRDLDRTPSSTLLYDFGQALRGMGWQRRECPPSGPPAYRWTGPGTVSTLDLPQIAPPNGNCLLEFRVIATQATAPDILDSLSVLVNQNPVRLNTLHSDRGVKLLQAVVAPEMLKSERPFTEVKFEVDRVTSLNAVNPLDPDTRQVGVALNYVQLFPQETERQHSAAAQLFEDEAWKNTIDFLSQHLQPQEVVIAPLAFRVMVNNSVLDYDAFLEGKQAQWLVLHKGMAAQISTILMKLLGRGLSPVFANEVFVLYSNRQGIATANYASKHVRPVYIDRVKKNVEHKLKTLYRQYAGKKQLIRSSPKG
ncbi:sulfotransferase family 2 domain-containing protein [Leptolyngbya sp. FACHB-711]|uniref:sulfotransferase family 2 domain-containing protein n=1 Tax=unclassified Leptolyngbya TaxID=2650499 RepID=UPI001683F251|nr:sulfotransferase family 2 domain-containing protein [Leptolyngbya sp. FACHB-711]MBD1851582.1 sulfotransferase family 2 domain-containing protein [Cyanobacteria bacterium FACHB-502]MBD2026405.1 sulfotransferase family 2 domain-containing protein [Leptolyngbya sp. FACHB-711]